MGSTSEVEFHTRGLPPSVSWDIQRDDLCLPKCAAMTSRGEQLLVGSSAGIIAFFNRYNLSPEALHATISDSDRSHSVDSGKPSENVVAET